MELAGVGDLGVEVGDLGTQAPAWSHHLEEGCGRGRGVGHQCTLKILPTVPRRGYRGASGGDSERGMLVTSDQEFLPTSCPGPWFGLENSDPNTDTLVKSPDWVWCGKSNYTSLTWTS